MGGEIFGYPRHLAEIPHGLSYADCRTPHHAIIKEAKFYTIEGLIGCLAAIHVSTPMG